MIRIKTKNELSMIYTLSLYKLSILYPNKKKKEGS